MAQDDTRGMTVYFMDGSKMRFTGPKQAKDDWDAIRKTQMILERPYLCLETEDSAIIIPMANVKYQSPHRFRNSFSRTYIWSKADARTQSGWCHRSSRRFIALETDPSSRINPDPLT